VHQLFEDMEIREKEFVATNMGLKDATNCHIFLLAYVF
jgi:hypothetical protein